MEFAFIFGNQYNESGAVQQMPGKKGEQPLAPTKSVGRHIGVVAVLSPAPAGRHTIAHGNAVGMGTRPWCNAVDHGVGASRSGMTGNEPEWVGGRIAS